MSDRPIPGSRIEMPFMGDDVDIIADQVPEEQPLEKFGILFILDQYGEEHLVQKDADTWITTSIDELDDEAFEIYEATAIHKDGERGLRRAYNG